MNGSRPIDVIAAFYELARREGYRLPAAAIFRSILRDGIALLVSAREFEHAIYMLREGLLEVKRCGAARRALSSHPSISSLLLSPSASSILGAR